MEGSARAVLNGPYVWGAPLKLEAQPPARLRASFSVDYSYVVEFTRNALDPDNDLLASIVEAAIPPKLLAVLDGDVVEHRPELLAQIEAYAERHKDRLLLAGPPVVLRGGEQLKESREYSDIILTAIHDCRLDRHSYVLAIGGGALLDVAGYAAAIAHRGVRLIRMPTTVLSQDDSGVGVKNGINAFDTKNFEGTFAPPAAVINDEMFLTTLSDRDWLSGVSEAIKVALLGDADLFFEIEQAVPALLNRDLEAMSLVVRRSAQLHLTHIVNGGDPFESTSARPLDFGHWSAHKLEKITEPRLRHGEAVAIGIALDCTYGWMSGLMPEADWRRSIALLQALRLPITTPELDDPRLLDGLSEFREHLGGELTIAMVDGIGSGLVVHEMDQGLIRAAIERLRVEDEQSR
jgi:3-dehydroquinate synthase